MSEEAEYSNASEEAEEELVRQSLPWKLETFPTRYLGLHLGIKQLTAIRMAAYCG